MSDTPNRVMPKGGRKGGKMFPQVSLKKAVEYARKLVSKTHTGPQPAETILPGVFGASGGKGGVRASALKQFSLMEGEADAYKATELAKKISAATTEDLQSLLISVCLKPAIFKSLFDTFKGDSISTARIRQQASNLDVHPDNLELCVTVFTESAEFAGLARREGDNFVFEKDTTNVPPPATINTDNSVQADEQQQDAPPAEKQSNIAAKSDLKAPEQDRPPSGRSVIHVNIDLDSSLDTEKLEKQLELLRKFGAI